VEIVVVIGAIVVTVLVFTWMLKVVKATLKTAFLVAAILLALQLIFGIGPGVIWETIQGWLPPMGQAGGG
jgi:type IV secretory pathway TrbL component